MSDAGFQFEIVPPCIKEKLDPALTLRELTLWNAIQKLMAVAQGYPDSSALPSYRREELVFAISSTLS